MPSGERNGIVESDGMPDPEDHKDCCPQQPALPVENSKRDEKGQKSLGDLPVTPPQKRVCDVASIQLSHREEGECSYKKTEPGGDPHGMQVDIHSGRWCLADEPCDKFEDQRFSETDSGLLRVYGDEGRVHKTNHQNWNCH